MADWEHETRRYIYRSTDPKWLAIDATSRALAALLIPLADEDGAIDVRADEQPHDAIARVTQSRGRKVLAWCKSATQDLLDDTYLVFEPATDNQRARVVLRNFKVAQQITDSAAVLSARRSRDAQRKALIRAQSRESSSSKDGPRTP